MFEEEQDWLKIKEDLFKILSGKKKKLGDKLKNVQNSANAVVEMLTGTKIV